MWRKLLCVLSAFMLCSLVAACGSINRSDGVTPEQVKKIVKGKTTKDEIRAMLGEPTDIRMGGRSGETWSYLPKHSRDVTTSATSNMASTGLSKALGGLSRATGLGKSSAGQVAMSGVGGASRAAAGNQFNENRGNDGSLVLFFSGNVVKDYSYSYRPGK